MSTVPAGTDRWMRGPRRAGTAQSLVFGFALITSAQGRGAPPAASPQPATFLQNLQRAVDSVDRRTVAGMVSYPLTVLASPFNIPVKDQSAFIRLYDSVFTPELRCAIVAAESPSVAPPRSKYAVTMTPDGLMIADGAIWAPLKDGRYRIARIRVLPKAPSVEGRRGIQRVTFDPPRGERSATFAGWLVRRNVDSFVAAVRRGETIQARIDGFRGHDATVRLAIVDASNARTNPPSDIGRIATEKATADGEYQIDVAHLAPYCDPPQRYRLTITVRPYGLGP